MGHIIIIDMKIWPPIMYPQGVYILCFIELLSCEVGSFIDDDIGSGWFNVCYEILLTSLCDVLGVADLKGMEAGFGHILAGVHTPFDGVRWVHNLNIEFIGLVKACEHII